MKLKSLYDIFIVNFLVSSRFIRTDRTFKTIANNLQLLCILADIMSLYSEVLMSNNEFATFVIALFVTGYTVSMTCSAGTTFRNGRIHNGKRSRQKKLLTDKLYEKRLKMTGKVLTLERKKCLMV